MRPIRLLTLAAAVLLAAAAPYSVRLDVASCSALPPGRVAELGPDWSALVPYVQRCPVSGPDGHLALSVDIVRLDRAALAADFFTAHPDQPVPLPLLRDAAGTVVGSLPEGFPIDPPGILKVRFADWRRGVPQRIDLYQAGESALPPHPVPPLRWNGAARRYQ